MLPTIRAKHLSIYDSFKLFIQILYTEKLLTDQQMSKAVINYEIEQNLKK